MNDDNRVEVLMLQYKWYEMHLATALNLSSAGDIAFV